MTASAPHASTNVKADSSEGYAISAVGLSVAYDSTAVLRDVSLHVPWGSIYGLIGPSGAGKSTVLRVLATLVKSNSGSVEVNGVDVVRNPSGVRAGIGYLPDVSGVYEGLTLGEYLDFYGAIHGLPLRKRRVAADELLELFGLGDRRTSAVGSLTRGMRQRLHLARCLLHDPAILLLDEPASGMDPNSRLDLRDILQELAGMNKTVIIASHLLSELNETCTHIGMLRAGALVADGTLDDVIHSIAPMSTAQLHLLDSATAEVARRHIEEIPNCHDVEAAGTSSLHFRFDGTVQEEAQVISRLTNSGITLSELTWNRPTLEDAYFAVIDNEPAA